ncbi:coilin-like [Iris pallida]|uniref:Coilin-like n=1 Tax=Iris pallida TaxID=29817 RepID=A0AAX6EZJ5_IRIPA|nr:coilin-like [Iris pallida]
MAEEEPVRIRVEFGDRKLLSRSRRSDGLSRAWILLRPEMGTIADVAGYVRRRFGLRGSCPDGLLLTMDDFVLPPFESTCILKDKDIIRVQKKGASLINVIEADNNQHYIQDSGIVERQPIYSNPGFLAIKEFQEDSVGRQNKNDEDSYPQKENPVLIRTLSSENTNSKRKRKHSDTTPSSKRKKSKLVRPEKSILDAEDVDDIPREQNLSCFEKGESSKKSSNKKCRTSNVDGNLLAVVDSMLDARISKLPSSVLTEERNNKPEENNACGPHVNGSSTKVQGRNARRKKERRQWLSEILSQNKDIQSEEQPNSIHKISTEEERVLNSEVQEEVVPVEIRPGHIRFESLDAGESLHQSQGAMETLQWNGITGKKQGQKWGRENTDRKWNNDNGFKEYPKSNYVAEGWNNNGNLLLKAGREIETVLLKAGKEMETLLLKGGKEMEILLLKGGKEMEILLMEAGEK